MWRETLVPEFLEFSLAKFTFRVANDRYFTDGVWAKEENGRVTRPGTKATIEKVTDRAEFQRCNLLATPGLVINEKLAPAGRMPSESEVMTWVAEALNWRKFDWRITTKT
jgi:hypothetical protein